MNLENLSKEDKEKLFLEFASKEKFICKELQMALQSAIRKHPVSTIQIIGALEATKFTFLDSLLAVEDIEIDDTDEAFGL